MWALGRPEEWGVGDGCQFLIHRSTGIRVYAHGQTYRSGGTIFSPVRSMTTDYHICTAPQKTVTRCWSAVSAREAEARRKNEERGQATFLNSFPGFRS